MNQTKTLIRMAIDLANGKPSTNYSATDAQETVRAALAELAAFSIDGGKNGKMVIDRKTFRDNKSQLFAILEEIINETLAEGLGNQFDGFADYRSLNWGDENKFIVPASNMFKIALVSDGNGNIRRQRLVDGTDFSVGLDTYAIKIGEDFHRFLANRVDWSDLMAGIASSFQRHMTQRIYKAVMASYGRYNGTYHMSGNLTEDDLVELAMHIEARTGSKVAVYGTKLALRKLAPSAVTEALLNARNEVGYHTNIAGIPLREIEQSHEYGTDEFAIDNDMILVLPQDSDKMVKVVNEGDAIIQDQAGGQTADMMQEYFIATRFGVSIITSKVFGFVKLADGPLTPAPAVAQGTEVN